MYDQLETASTSILSNLCILACQSNTLTLRIRERNSGHGQIFVSKWGWVLTSREVFFFIIIFSFSNSTHLCVLRKLLIPEKFFFVCDNNYKNFSFFFLFPNLPICPFLLSFKFMDSFHCYCILICIYPK